MVAIVLAGLAFALPGARRPLTVLAALAIATSGAIGVFHAGVEQHWWEGITGCATSASGTIDPGALLDEIMNAPVVRCDQIAWSFLGLSLAGWNAIISIATSILVLTGVMKGARA